MSPLIAPLVEIVIGFARPVTLVAGTCSGDIALWNAETLEPEEGTFADPHTREVTSMAALRGHLLATASFDTTVRIWDMMTFQCMFTLRWHSNRVSSLVSLPGYKLASGAWDCTVRVWYLPDNSQWRCHVLEGHAKGVTCLTVLPDGTLVSGSDDNTVRFWSLPNDKDSHYQCVRVLEIDECPWSLCALPGQFLAVGKCLGGIGLKNLQHGMRLSINYIT